jgi:hypothetical protein
MAVIAAFHLLQADRLGDLLEAAAPQPKTITVKGFFFNRQRTIEGDSLREFVRENAERLSLFKGPGLAFTSLDRFLSRRKVGPLLSPARLVRPGEAIGFLDAKQAAALLEALKALRLTEKDVKEFIIEESGSSDFYAIGAFFGAFRQLQAWLAEVKEKQVGLLYIETTEAIVPESVELPAIEDS